MAREGIAVAQSEIDPNDIALGDHNHLGPNGPVVGLLAAFVEITLRSTRTFKHCL